MPNNKESLRDNYQRMPAESTLQTQFPSLPEEAIQEYRKNMQLIRSNLEELDAIKPAETIKETKPTFPKTKKLIKNVAAVTGFKQPSKTNPSASVTDPEGIIADIATLLAFNLNLLLDSQKIFLTELARYGLNDQITKIQEEFSSHKLNENKLMDTIEFIKKQVQPLQAAQKAQATNVADENAWMQVYHDKLQVNFEKLRQSLPEEFEQTCYNINFQLGNCKKLLTQEPSDPSRRKKILEILENILDLHQELEIKSKEVQNRKVETAVKSYLDTAKDILQNFINRLNDFIVAPIKKRLYTPAASSQNSSGNNQPTTPPPPTQKPTQQ